MHRSRVAFEQIDQARGNAFALAEIPLGLVAVGGVDSFALFRGHHLQRQLVVAAQKREPATGIRDVGGEIGREGVKNRLGRGFGQRQIDARHHREMVSRLAFVAVAEIGDHLGRRLAGFGQQNGARAHGVQHGAEELDDSVGAGQVLADRAFFLPQIRNRVGAEAVHALRHPKQQHAAHGQQYFGVAVVQIGLRVEEAVEKVGVGRFRQGVPVAGHHAFEDDARFFVLLGGVAPDEVVAVGVIGAFAGLLEPHVLVGAVVHGHVEDHPDATAVGLGQKFGECALCGGITAAHQLAADLGVVADVKARVAHRRIQNGQQPQAGHAQVLQIGQAVR